MSGILFALIYEYNTPGFNVKKGIFGFMNSDFFVTGFTGEELRFELPALGRAVKFAFGNRNYSAGVSKSACGGRN